MNIGILGGGSWAIGLAVLLSRRGHAIRMWEFSAKDAQMLAEKREHPVKLPGIMIPDDILITNSLSEAFVDADVVLCVVPAQTVRATMKAVVEQVESAARARPRAWIIASKGIECETLSLMNEIIIDVVPEVTFEKIVVLSGPSHAEEVSRDIPTTIVAASVNNELAVEIQEEFSNETFRVYTNNDPTGVELCASVKNVIAVAAGICDGLGFGDNTKGALLTRGMVEIVRLGKAMGAQETTFNGLAGFGDLITTCISKHSRNRRFGELIGKGNSLEEALSQMTMVAEGVETTRSTYALAQKMGIEMPITNEIYRTLFEGKDPVQAVRDLMLRRSKPETLQREGEEPGVF